MIDPELREILRGMANKLAFLHDAWPRMAAALMSVEQQVKEHERRIMQIESRRNPASDPPGSSRISASDTGNHVVVQLDGRPRMMSVESIERILTQHDAKQEVETWRWLKKNSAKITTHVLAVAATAAAAIAWHLLTR